MSDEPPEPELRTKRQALGADLIIPVLAAGLTIYFLVNTAGLVWEARANGTVIGATLLILVAVQLVRVGVEVRRGRASLGFGSLLERSTVQAQRLGLLVVLAAFIAAIPWVGTTLGLFLALCASMWLLGVRDPRALLGIPLAVAASVYVLFVVLLQSRLPVGPIEHFLGSLLAGRA
jgi:hypothetical protein